MGITLNPSISLLLLAVLLAGAYFVFWRVHLDYNRLGKLSRPTAIPRAALMEVEHAETDGASFHMAPNIGVYTK